MKRYKLFCSIAAAVFIAASAYSKGVAPEAVPGTFENAAPAKMQNILELDAKLNIGSDEFVLYYFRPDGNYGAWALWMWASPGGDGSAIWPYSQKWSVQDGIGYMRFKLNGADTGGNKFTSSEGNIGFIIRQKNEWIKDGSEDRMWNVNVSKKAAVFSNDPVTYAALDYKPSIRSAELYALNKIKAELSGKFALDADGGFSGFSIIGSSGKEYALLKVYNTAFPKNPEKNMAADVTIELAENVSIEDKVFIKNPLFRGDAAVNSSKLAISIAESAVPSSNMVLGCTYSSGKAVFNLWAPTSSSAVLNLYKEADSVKADYSMSMTKDPASGVWTAVFDSSDPDGMFYDYTLQNAKGTVTVLDPYASSMAAYKGKGGFCRAAVIDFNSPKAGTSDFPYAQLAKREDAVIYEVSVRDFTISSDSGVKSIPGTYNAFIEKIPYLKELGITHVQLLPVLNFFNNDETAKSYEASGTVNANNYNWGYDPHNYFSPEGWYASDTNDPYCRVRELRNLINECHKEGIGVILDVVYNHMAGIQFLDDIVPGYYFRTDDRGALKSNSGCGNDTATERKMMKKLVADSTVHWVKNYKADGFRFDLMGLMEVSSVLDSYNLCAKINPCVLFVGEGWKMYNGTPGTYGMDQNYMIKTDKVAVFNDEYRDIMKAGGFNETGRGFITKKGIDASRLAGNIKGSPISNYKTDQPGDNLNYLVCHDGLTLHDAIVHNLKLDENKDKAEIIQRIKLGNFFVLTSQGIAFLHAGQERGRTKPNIKGAKNECIGNFVRNSYDSADNINNIVWNMDDDYKNLLEYTKGLIDIRKTFDVFRIGNAKKISKSFTLLKIENSEDLVFGYKMKYSGKNWFILINAKKETAEINTGVSLNTSVIYVDSESADKNGIKNPKGIKLSGTSVTLDPLTAAVICVK